MSVCKRSNHALGFTLIELLLGICLLCLIMTFAVPTYGHWIASRQLANHAEFLAETLNLARSEAVKRGLRVNLCKTIDHHQCADAGGWQSGWIMFVDANKSGEIDAAEDVLHVEGPPGNGITVSANHPLADYVSYTSFGFARQLNGALQMGKFVVCKPGLNAIHVVLANSGRVRIDRTGIPCP
jgi:type IV fimbrial biogenesis protein FimT